MTSILSHESEEAGIALVELDSERRSTLMDLGVTPEVSPRESTGSSSDREPTLKTKETEAATLLSNIFQMSDRILRRCPLHRTFTSLRPNHRLVAAYIDRSFEGREQRLEAKEIVEAYTFRPWKGLVWTEPDGERLRWTGTAWEPATPLTVIEKNATVATCSNVDAGLMQRFSEAASNRESVQIAKEELNEVYETYERDPDGAAEQFWALIYGYIHVKWRIKQCRNFLNKLPETADEVSDILADFFVEIRRRMTANQYQHQGKLAAWIDKIWKSYFFPGVQAKLNEYVNSTRWANNVDPRDPEYKHEPYCVNTAEIGSDGIDLGNARLAVQRVLRELNDPRSPLSSLSDETKDRIRKGNVGLKGVDLAKRIDVSNVHACRLVREDKQAFRRVLGQKAA